MANEEGVQEEHDCFATKAMSLLQGHEKWTQGKYMQEKMVGKGSLALTVQEYSCYRGSQLTCRLEPARKPRQKGSGRPNKQQQGGQKKQKQKPGKGRGKGGKA